MSTPLSSVTMLCNREKYKEEMMLTDRHDEPCTYRSNDDIEEILQRYDAYIVALARKKMPRTVVPLALLPDEREDLAQRVRIKLWQTLQKRRVVNLKAYIDCIVFTEVIDLLRRHRAPLPLPLDDDEECSWEEVRGTPLKDTHDPAQQIEQDLSGVTSCTHDFPTMTGNTATAVITLGASSGQTVKFKVILIQDRNGDWKINSFQKA
jgi:DNA-directed RNA polymerase specialized sigma24 family protein